MFASICSLNSSHLFAQTGTLLSSDIIKPALSLEIGSSEGYTYSFPLVVRFPGLIPSPYKNEMGHRGMMFIISATIYFLIQRSAGISAILLFNFCCQFQIKVRAVHNDAAKKKYCLTSIAMIMASSIGRDSLFRISQSLGIAF